MSVSELAFRAALIVMPLIGATSVARLYIQYVDVCRRRPKLTTFVGASVGLLFIPLAVVTVGTIGGGYWDYFSLPGGPLVGVVAAISVTCTLAVAVLIGAGVLTSRVATWAQTDVRCLGTRPDARFPPRRPNVGSPEARSRPLATRCGLRDPHPLWRHGR